MNTWVDTKSKNQTSSRPQGVGFLGVTHPTSGCNQLTNKYMRHLIQARTNTKYENQKTKQASQDRQAS
jgi:hypothetical protein